MNRQMVKQPIAMLPNGVPVYESDLSPTRPRVVLLGLVIVVLLIVGLGVLEALI
jgi:hypothetical protein